MHACLACSGCRQPFWSPLWIITSFFLREKSSEVCSSPYCKGGTAHWIGYLQTSPSFTPLEIGRQPHHAKVSPHFTFSSNPASSAIRFVLLCSCSQSLFPFLPHRHHCLACFEPKLGLCLGVLRKGAAGKTSPTTAQRLLRPRLAT